MVLSGSSPDDLLVEFIELPAETHPFFVATQAHPEFKSRPNRPHPLFAAFVEAARRAGRRSLAAPADRDRTSGERGRGAAAVTVDADRVTADELARLLAEHDDWLAVERGLAANSLAAYRRDLRRYAGFLRDRGESDPAAHRRGTSCRTTCAISRRSPTTTGNRAARGVVDRACARGGAVVPRLLRDGGSAADRSERGGRRAACPAGDPEGARRGRRSSGCSARSRATGRCRSATARCSRRSTDRHPHQRGGRARARRSRSRRRRRARARQGRQGTDRARSAASARGVVERVPARRPARAAQRAARGAAVDSDAVVLERAWWAHQPPGVLVDRAQRGRAGRARRAPLAARAAALVRDPHARPRRRPAGRAGAARPREHLDHPGVHEGVAGAAASRLRRRPPEGAGDGSGLTEAGAARRDRATRGYHRATAASDMGRWYPRAAASTGGLRRPRQPRIRVACARGWAAS